MRIAIIGGHNQDTYGKLFKRMGQVEIHFHDGIPKKNNKRSMETLIRDVDYIIIVQGACSHTSMWDAKEAAKKCNKEVLYTKGIGISSMVNRIRAHQAS
jgi:hypothetical protein